MSSIIPIVIYSRIHTKLNINNNQHTIKILFSLFSEYSSENTLMPYSKIFSKEFFEWINNKYGVLFILTTDIEQEMYITDPKKKLLFDIKYS